MKIETARQKIISKYMRKPSAHVVNNFGMNYVGRGI